MRVVFDTNTVISALLFRGKLSALVQHWRQENITPLICEETRTEFLRVLVYPKFKLNVEQVDILASHYLPYAETVTISEANKNHLPKCRDNKDQIFLELAFNLKRAVGKCCRPFVLTPHLTLGEGRSMKGLQHFHRSGEASNYRSPFDRLRANGSLRLSTALFRFNRQADFLVTGDEDLLVLRTQTPFEIITSADYLTLHVHKYTQ